MGSGDILLLCTDGLLEHTQDDEDYFPRHLEHTLCEVKHLGARGIFDAVIGNVLAFGEPSDDISLVVIKRH
jgi:hypothetical protein